MAVVAVEVEQGTWLGDSVLLNLVVDGQSLKARTFENRESRLLVPFEIST
jgi:hypothetical protein